jgi:hypothetical protein
MSPCACAAARPAPVCAHEPRASQRIGRERRRQNFQRDDAVQRRIARLEHDAHAAARDVRNDFVRPESAEHTRLVRRLKEIQLGRRRGFRANIADIRFELVHRPPQRLGV